MFSKFNVMLALAAILATVTALVLMPGCGGDSSSETANKRDPEEKKVDTGAAPVAPKAAVKKAGGGEPYDKAMAKTVIKGVVSLEGTPPKMPEIDVSEKVCKEHHAGNPLREERILAADGKLANVVVYVSKGFEKWNFDNYKLPNAQVNQEGCQYIPHVLAMKTDQGLEIKSSDPVAHNVHGDPKENQTFNFAQPSKGILPTTPTFGTAELGIPVKCDVHGWMKAWICVFDHPFFAVTKADGSFEINVPPGEYTISTWHEQTQFKKVIAPAAVVVKVEADKPAEVNLTYKVK